jgi:hypothetical protein
MQDLNWGNRVADTDTDAISVAIVDEVVGCVSGNCLTLCARNPFQFYCNIVRNEKRGKKHRGDSVTVSQCHRATGRGDFAGRTIYYSEPRENSIYRKSRNE